MSDETAEKPCDECDWTFSCFTNPAECCKRPTAKPIDGETLKEWGAEINEQWSWPPDELELVEHRRDLARALLASQSALAEAKAEIQKLDSNGALREARLLALEAALAQVPHLAHDYGKDAFRFIGPMAADDSHDKKACATFGGRCAALASPSEPAGGRKGE